MLQKCQIYVAKMSNLMLQKCQFDVIAKMSILIIYMYNNFFVEVS